MVYLTFLWAFNAVHRLWNPALSRAQNIDAFGECCNTSGHGHRYRLEVTVAAQVDHARPVAMERGALRRLVDETLSPGLHNRDMDTAFGRKGFISTGENVVREIWELIAPALPEGVSLTRVKVIETRKNSFTYTGNVPGGRPARPMI
jgi:6-pyruvoyltetrahydropterin/6-carboxytetrahydropterin synthase